MRDFLCTGNSFRLRMAGHKYLVFMLPRIRNKAAVSGFVFGGAYCHLSGPHHRQKDKLMKVAFVGSHGMGKTTLCYDLVARLKKKGIDADLVKEVARSCPLPVNQTTSLAAQQWILFTQMAEEIKTSARCAVTVCDRSVLDNYAYLVRQCERQKSMEPLLRQWLMTYDLLIYVPVMPVEDDGFRDTDVAFVNDIDRAVKDELNGRGSLRNYSLNEMGLHSLASAYPDTLLLQGDRNLWCDKVLAYVLNIHSRLLNQHNGEPS